MLTRKTYTPDLEAEAAKLTHRMAVNGRKTRG
jgi:hypothetical protein